MEAEECFDCLGGELADVGERVGGCDFGVFKVVVVVGCWHFALLGLFKGFVFVFCRYFEVDGGGEEVGNCEFFHVDKFLRVMLFLLL